MKIRYTRNIHTEQRGGFVTSGTDPVPAGTESRVIEIPEGSPAPADAVVVDGATPVSDWTPDEQGESN